MRCSVAGRSTVAGTSLRAIASLFSTSKGFRLREVGVFNTTSTALAVALVQLSRATGVGEAIVAVQWGVEPAPTVKAYTGHIADGIVGAAIRQASLGGAVGSGVIWTFGDMGVNIASTRGIGIICPTGAGQILDYYYDWEE